MKRYFKLIAMTVVVALFLSGFAAVLGALLWADMQPAERALASATTSDAGKSRPARISSMVVPTAPVAPPICFACASVRSNPS